MGNEEHLSARRLLHNRVSNGNEMFRSLWSAADSSAAARGQRPPTARSPTHRHGHAPSNPRHRHPPRHDRLGPRVRRSARSRRARRRKAVDLRALDRRLRQAGHRRALARVPAGRTRLSRAAADDADGLDQARAAGLSRADARFARQREELRRAAADARAAGRCPRPGSYLAHFRADSIVDDCELDPPAARRTGHDLERARPELRRLLRDALSVGASGRPARGVRHRRAAAARRERGRLLPRDLSGGAAARRASISRAIPATKRLPRASCSTCTSTR